MCWSVPTLSANTEKAHYFPNAAGNSSFLANATQTGGYGASVGYQCSVVSGVPRGSLHSMLRTFPWPHTLDSNERVVIRSVMMSSVI